jgi:L-seryl-tRNA(Ser) seleniumtransferase
MTASLRSLPQVEVLLRHPALAEALASAPRPVVVDAVRAVLDEERARLRRARGGPAAPPADLARRAADRARREAAPALRRVLNATGVVLHTNLGRSPLSERARRLMEEVARGYCNLEFELESGRRGERGVEVERRLARLCGAEAALVVNNGAAALLLALSALAAGRELLVSRGELVEIGGSFRLPEIMEKSGAIVVEVGTTNRTHLSDYQRAFERHRDVALVLRVHPSNFRIEGYASRPPLEELARLAHRRRVPVVEDLGSGALVDLGPLGLPGEPTVRQSLTAGCDLVSFSGD